MTLRPPPGLDLERLAAFLDPHVGGLDGPLRGTVIAGGKSNLTYEIGDGERRWAVRRPPLAHVLPTAHDMAREWRVIRALQSSDIPVPQAIAFCDDLDVVGAPFYVMGFVDGHVVRDHIPGAFANLPETRTAMSAALVNTLVRLHTVDAGDIGLGDFGRPEGFLERQLRRWRTQWEASKTRELPSIEELRRRLERSLPPQSPSGIVHGDYRLDNVVFAPDDPAGIVAILDWEMSTIGDPLCDVGLLMMYWGDRSDDAAVGGLPSRALCREEGFYTRAQILDRYAAQSQRDCSMIDWYVALGAYKLAVINQGIAYRHRLGMTVGEGFDGIEQVVPVLVGLALDRASASAIPGLRGA